MQRKWSIVLALLAGSWYFGPAAPLADRSVGAEEKAAAQGEKAKSDKDAKKPDAIFLRVVRDAKKVPMTLDTSIVRYVGTKGAFAGVTVDLIGAVHIGEKSYYQKLNEQFTKYESLLYELVAPKGTKIPKGGRGGSGHPVGMLQEGMTEVLGLAYQLEEIDYTQKNFVHADMTPKQFDAKMEERGESWWSMFFKMMGHSMAVQAGRTDSPEFELLGAMFASNRELAMKRALAKQFESMEAMMGAFEGQEGSTIITERNKAALAVMKDQVAAGKKTLGIFYGAGHLPDMDRRLREEFGLERKQVDWVVAWDMRDAEQKAVAAKQARPKAAEKAHEKKDEASKQADKKDQAK